MFSAIIGIYFIFIYFKIKYKKYLSTVNAKF